jgi:hypothetical protein
MLAFRPVVATARPHMKKSQKISRKLKHAIEHAKLICVNYEDTKECGVAWDQVEELSAALNDQFMIEKNEELSKREYDV